MLFEIFLIFPNSYIENEEMKNKTKGRTNDLLEMGYYLYSKILDKLNK